MEKFISTQKFILTSPRKIRPVAKSALKLRPDDAVVRLNHSPNKSAVILAKVIKTAIAQAQQNGVSSERLVFSEIQIGEGPILKRGIAVSRGQWHPIKRRMSHIRVVLASKDKNNSEAGKKVVGKKNETVKSQEKDAAKKVVSSRSQSNQKSGLRSLVKTSKTKKETKSKK